MGSNVEDRRRHAYENATTLSQAMLDETFRGQNSQIECIGTLVKTLAANFTITIASPGVVTSAAHGLNDGDPIVLTTTGALPTGLTAGGTYYVRDKTADTFRLAATAGGSAINTTGSQSGTHTWTRTYTLRFADRPKFVGDDFYEGRARFPQIKRTIGDPQAPTIEFSSVEVELSNLDGFYNAYLEGGADYFSPIGARLTIKVGLRDVSGSFITIFDGFVPEEDGFSNERERITIRATDRFNDLNKRSPLPSINETDFPSAPADSIGKLIPLVFGDWEAGYNLVEDAGAVQVQESGTTYDVVVDQPSGFYGGTIGYYVGGGYFVFSIGGYGATTITPDTIADCHIKRGDILMQAAFTAAPANTAGYWSVEVTGLAKVGGGTVAYAYQNGDVAVLKVKVPYGASKYSNMIEIAEVLLFALGGRVAGDLDSSSWSTLKAKATPAQSDMTTIKARVWVGTERDSVLAIVLGLLEQVRVEMFIDANGKIKLSTLHPEDFPAPASATRIDQCEVDEESLQLRADDKTFFNQAWLNYGYTPVTGKTELSTVQKKNANSIARAGKTVAKIIDCPNLYVESEAENQLIEFLRLYSTGLTFLTVHAAWVHLLRDLAGFVAFNYDIGGVDYAEKPMMIRDAGFDPATGAVILKLLSLANFPYASYSPSNSARMLSSSSQSITNA